MNSQMNTKVRLVRCPRCREVLAELPNVPVYECGGCGIILQAKNKKRDIQGTGSLVREGGLTKENGLDYVRNLSTYESDSEKSPERCDSDTDCRKECGGLNQSHEYHSSDVISCHENTESSPESNGHAGGEKYRTEARDDDAKHPGDTSGSNENLSSPRLDIHEGQSLVQRSKTYDNESFTSSPIKEDESQCSLENYSDGGQYGSQKCKQELPISTSFSRDFSVSDEFTRETGNPSAVSGRDREVNEMLDNHVISTSMNAIALETSTNGRIHKERSSSVESDSPDNQTFPCSEPIKQAQDGTRSEFQHVSSADSLGNFPHVYARTDLGVTLRSSTAKNYYAYGVDTSSSKETEDQLPSQQKQPSRRNFKDAEFSSTKRIPKRNELMVTRSENELPQRPRHSEALRTHPTPKGSKWNQDEFQEPTGRSHPLSSMLATETGTYLSRPPLYPKGSQPMYKNGGSSSYEQKSLPQRNVDPESDKLELLRMVYELQDQLRIAHVSKGMPHGRFSSTNAEQERLSAHGNQFPLSRDTYPDPRYHKYPGQQDQNRSWFQLGKVPRNAFSGEATQFRHEVDCSCLDCYRQRWNYSSQLPQPAGYNARHTVAYPRDDRYSAYHFASSSLHQYIPFEFTSRNHDTKSDDKHQTNFEVKRKQQPAKQHFRPIAGGSPIIACYCCNEILQLPADFLLFKRRCHRLRCSACSMVLKFSLENQFNLVKYNSEPRTPPPSEVGDFVETKKIASTSHASGYQHGVQVSDSHDYGQSFRRSSTDMEQFSRAPRFETVNKISDDKKIGTGNPFQTNKEGKEKSIIHDSGDSYKNPAENFEFAGPSSMMYKPNNSFSEIEEVSPEGESHLHRLMGYSSPNRFVYH